MSTTDIDAELRDVLRAISNDGPLGTEHVDELCSRFIESFRASESEQTDHFNREERDFRERCYKRWRSGLDLLQVFRHFCAEVGSLFQKKFYRVRLQIPTRYALAASSCGSTLMPAASARSRWKRC